MNVSQNRFYNNNKIVQLTVLGWENWFVKMGVNLTVCAPLTWLEADVVASAGFVNFTWQQKALVYLLAGGRILPSWLQFGSKKGAKQQEY